MGRGTVRYVNGIEFESTGRRLRVARHGVEKLRERTVWVGHGELDDGEYCFLDGMYYPLCELDRMEGRELVRGHGKLARYQMARVTGGEVAGPWAILTRSQQRYAAHLVEDYGERVAVAIQAAFFFGYDHWQYDYRKHEQVEESLPRELWFY